MRWVCFLSCLCMCMSLVYGDKPDIDNEDIKALRDWINSKRAITVRELGGQLSISGEVRTELQMTSEHVNGISLRGAGTHLPKNGYDVECYLAIDYRADRTWASARLRTDNDAGIMHTSFGSGKNDRFKIDKAYFGYRLIDEGQRTMSLEVGRKGMFLLFDSKLQFASNFDGISLKDVWVVDGVGDLHYQLGAFLVNEKNNQAAYVGECGIANLAHTGFHVKYSFIDWDTKKCTQIPAQFKFLVSQLSCGYRCSPQPWNQTVRFYLGGLYNHRASKLEISANRRANYGGYFGCSVGELKRAGDWNIDANYQLLAAQCIPEFDVLGIGLSSVRDCGFYFIKGKDAKGKEVLHPNTVGNAQGNVNFRGFRTAVQYMLTNNLTMLVDWSQSIRLDHRVGPFRKYKQAECELIYAF